MNQERLNRFQSLMEQSEIQAAAINAGSKLKYLTGLDFHLSERPVLLLISKNKKPVLFFPEFERQKAESAKIELNLFSYGEDPQKWADNLRPAVRSLQLENQIIGVAPESMRFLELDLLERATGHHDIVSAADLFQELLIRKDEAEFEEIKKAVTIAENAIEALLEKPLSGQTEKSIANQLVIYLLEKGSDPDLPFNPIVASGPNSANPHAVPSERVLHEGDIVVIDWGATSNGYISDITRSFQVGQLDENFEEIAGIVLKANQTGRSVVQPGIQALSVDRATRKIIADEGYGRYFTHRTGHGIGMLAHEEPFISEVSTTELAPGMVFTVEPGIYLPGEGGIRIEDNVLVTYSGSTTLTSLPRELRAIK